MISDRLRQAIQAGEVLTVVYHGGSNPGAVREIAPMEILGDKVSARCFTSEATKTFFIEQIEVIENSSVSHAPIWTPQVVDQPKFCSLADFVSANSNDWLSGGWHIEHQKAQLSLHRKFKTGKPHKNYDVSLNYEEYASDGDCGGETHIHVSLFGTDEDYGREAKSKQTHIHVSLFGESVLGQDEQDEVLPEENFRKRQRPWIVRAKNHNTSTYSSLDKATEMFLQHARNLAPGAF